MLSVSWIWLLLSLSAPSEQQGLVNEYSRCLSASSIGQCTTASQFCYYYIVPQYMPVWAPYSVTVSSTNVVVTRIRYITVQANGDEVTSYKYVTPGVNVSATNSPLQPLTWETQGTTLTYPTLYMSIEPDFFAVDWTKGGSSFTRFTNSSTSVSATASSDTCTNSPIPTMLPLGRSDVFFPLHVGADVLPPAATGTDDVLSWQTANNIFLSNEPVPPAMSTYLVDYPPLSSFFLQNGADIADCSVYICLGPGGPGSPPPAPIPVSHQTVEFITEDGADVITSASEPTGTSAPPSALPVAPEPGPSAAPPAEATPLNVEAPSGGGNAGSSPSPVGSNSPAADTSPGQSQDQGQGQGQGQSQGQGQGQVQSQPQSNSPAQVNGSPPPAPPPPSDISITLPESIVVITPTVISTNGNPSATAFVADAGTTLLPSNGVVTLGGGATVSLPSTLGAVGSEVTVTLSGSTIDARPTIVSTNGNPSATAYVFGSGSTLIPGGDAISLAGGATISLAPTPPGEGPRPGTAGPDVLLTLSGSVVTLHPTVVSTDINPSTTAYILGPGTTILPGREPVTLADGAIISIPPIPADEIPGFPGPDISVIISGSTFPFHPTVISTNGQSSVTAYVLGPDTTILPGGGVVTLPGGATISLPGPSPRPVPGSTTTDIGGAIRSGLGYTGAQYTGSGHRVRFNHLSWILFAATLYLTRTL